MEEPNGLRWRVGRLETRLDKLEGEKYDRQLGVLSNDVSSCHKAIDATRTDFVREMDKLREEVAHDMQEMKEEFINLKRIGLGVVITLLTGCIVLLASGLPGAG